MSVALYAFYLISLVSTSETAGEQCKVYQVPIRGKALHGHTYKTAKAGELFRCYVRCERDPACKSCNFKYTQEICEMNNETKETKPNDFITDEQSYYIKRTGGDVAECTAFPKICGANADCHNTDGSYICYCKAGYTGDGKTCFKADVNECEKGQTNLCSKYAFCNNTKESYNCHCKQGFVGDGFNCTDVNECEDGQTNLCDKYAFCNYTKGSYSCHCKQGFVGDGFDCTDVNECEKIKINLCGKYAFCNNTKGSYSCHCKQGFVRDGFNCTSVIPHPSAWFPLNGTYNTLEIENRTTQGSKGNKVYLSLGPAGTQEGSYFFRGSGDSLITFSDKNLDIRGSITLLCWLYIFDNNAETIFLQYKDTSLSVVVHGKTLTLKNSNSNDQSLRGTLAGKGWTFVGVSYNETSAEAQLWIFGNMVNSARLTTKLDSKGSQSLMLGGNNFKGKVTQLMLFNLTLTPEQILRLKGRIKLPAMIFNSTIISNNSFYRTELASFLAPAVGQMESKWKRCYNALADGWRTPIFHRNCDIKSHTVTIIEKKPYIFGGYTDIPWESPSGGAVGETLNAFIFSLTNSEGLPPFKCFAKNKDYAIYKNSRYGPTFGDYQGLRITDRDKGARGEAQAIIFDPYGVPTEVNDNVKVLAGIAGPFSPDNYEVFYLA